MSSRRFPGKMLAPFRGAPLVDHVVEAVRRALPDVPLVVATSQERTDDPLAEHLASRRVAVYRGDLADVVARFNGCLREHPATWVMRVCGDSPLLGAPVLRAAARAALSEAEDDVDLVTTIAPRTFPRGSNVEVLRATTLEGLASEPLSTEDREHLTRWIHGHPERYRIVNVESGRPELAELSVAVDSVEDLHRLEDLDEEAVWSSVRGTGGKS